MKCGLIVYNSLDREKNSWFINHALELLNSEDISLSYLDEDFVLDYLKTHRIDFVIYRARDCELVQKIEAKGVLVFNNSLTNKIANDKYLTFQFFQENKLPCIESFLDLSKLSYPFIMKSVSGHGGQEVFLIHDESERQGVIAEHPNLRFIYQNYAQNTGDVRIYVLDNQVIGAVKRTNTQDYRNNYSLGGEVSSYQLSQEMIKAAETISRLLGSTYFGVDLLLTKDGYLFNEIEDPVGSRMLLKASGIDSVTLFLENVKKRLLNK